MPPWDNPSDIDRLLSKVRVDEHGCWVFGGAYSTECGRQAPRAHFLYDGSVINAARAAWLMMRGPLDPGLVVDHYRMNPGPREAPCSTLCVNPDHLEPVSVTENNVRGRGASGTNARKTHCAAGHPLVLERRVAYRVRGWRSCRICINEKQRLRYQAMSPEAKEAYLAAALVRNRRRRAERRAERDTVA